MRINEIKKEKNKYLLKFDNSEMLVYEDVIIKFRLLNAREIDDKVYEEIKEYKRITDGYYLAKKFLSQPRSVFDVKRRLIEKDSYHEEIINILINQHYLDDYKFAETYMNYQKKYNLKGPKLIKRELEEKEISKDIIDKLEYGDYKENVEKIIAKLKKTVKNKSEKELKNHIKKYLFNKGYECSDIDFEVEVDEKSLIEKNALKLYNKYKNKSGIYEIKKKISVNLFQKGYKYEDINECLKKIGE